MSTRVCKTRRACWHFGWRSGSGRCGRCGSFPTPPHQPFPPLFPRIPAAVGLLSLVLMFALLPLKLKFYPRLQYKFNFTFLFARDAGLHLLLLSANWAQKCPDCSPNSVHFDGSSLVLAAAKFHTHKLFAPLHLSSTFAALWLRLCGRSCSGKTGKLYWHFLMAK